MDKLLVNQICKKAIAYFESNNIHIFKGMDKPLICVSDNYCGVWLEHIGDSIVYAETFPDKGIPLALNTIKTFISCQKNGQYPCYIWDDAKSKVSKRNNIGYGQVQECVSFGSLCLRLYHLTQDVGFLRECYYSLIKWVNWTEKYRMTTGRGLVEAFVGFDTGHDNSGRLDGMRYKENRRNLFYILNADVAPKKNDIAPICAVDMSANLFGNYTALSRMANILDMPNSALNWQFKATELKANMIKYLYDENDAFFYDIDKTGKKRKYLSCSILSLFQEYVLDVNDDKDMIDKLLSRHILNPDEFWTNYPFPSMAICDKSTLNHQQKNDWGYFTQGNTALRTSFWMDKYGLNKEQDKVCESWINAWTSAFDSFPLGQELDPVTGVHSPCSPWYSTGILFYLWSAKRLGCL